MQDENALLKSSFIDQLVQAKIARKREVAEVKAREKKKRKDMLCLASLERFLERKLDFRGNINDLSKLDEREIGNIKKLVSSDAKRKCVLFGLPYLGIVFSSFVMPLGGLISFGIGLGLGIIFMAIILPYLWFIFTGHYLGFYCKFCIKSNGTSICTCPVYD